MAYDATDRLASVSDGATVLGAYLHNAMGQRVSKTRSTGAVTHYLYDLSGRLIAEADGATGITHSEYIAFEGINLAYITTIGIYWVHGDHLGTPQMLTDDLGAQAWGALYAPFGMLLEETGALDFNLRFPGQYHDAETEFYYNYFRTYDPTSGRYVESDPIGLEGGWNTYGYVGGNPVMRVDPSGLLDPCVNDIGLSPQCQTQSGGGVGTTSGGKRFPGGGLGFAAILSFLGLSGDVPDTGVNACDELDDNDECELAKATARRIYNRIVTKRIPQYMYATRHGFADDGHLNAILEGQEALAEALKWVRRVCKPLPADYPKWERLANQSFPRRH